MGRPRHPDKDIERFLQHIEERGWRVEKAKKYFRIYCPCQNSAHQRSVHLTPSDPRYLTNVQRWVARQHREN